jgi:phosphohistidine phosphatase
MDLYLMQHGEATAENVDPARPLTEAGQATVRRVAERAAAAGVRVDACVHSGKLRAEQTAQILFGAVGAVGAVGAGDGPQARDGLAPNDPVAPTAEWLRGLGPDDAVAVVGHLPFLGRLASTLIAGNEGAEVIQFRMGGLVKLVSASDRSGFAVAWALVPELA